MSISTCSSQGAPCAQRPHKLEQEHFSTRTSSGDVSILNPGESEVFLVRKDKEAIKHSRKKAEKNTVSQITFSPSKYSILESNSSLHLVEGINSLCQKGINSNSDCIDQGSRKKNLSALLAHRKDKHSVVKMDSSSCPPTAILKRKKINVDPRTYTYEESHVLKSDSYNDHHLPEFDLSPSVKHSHAAAERKRKDLNKEEVCDSPSNGLLKGPKKPRIDHDDGNRVKVQAENNRVSQEAKGLDVTVTVQVKMQENRIVENLKKRKKKKKRPEKEGIPREVKELEAPRLSQKARLRLLVKGQLKKKAPKERDAVGKAKEIKGPHSLEKQESKYSSEYKSVCYDSEDARVEDFFVKRRDKEKDVKEDEEMDQKLIQETGFVHHENTVAEESEKHMCVDLHTHRSNSRDVDLIGSQTWTEVPEARKNGTEDPGMEPSLYETSHACWLDDSPTVVDCVDTKVKNLPRVGEKAVERRHSLVVKKALVKKYISPSTTNMKTSDVVNIGEPEQVMKQKVKQDLKKKVSKVEVQPKEREILNSYGPNLISVLNKHKTVRIEEPRKGSPATTEYVTKKEEVAAFVSSRGSQDIVYRPPGLARTKKVKFDRAGEVSSVLEKLSWPAFKPMTDSKQKKLKDPIAGIGDTSGVGNKGRIEEIRDGVASLSNAISAGCARCSINGWSWRSWARDRAKRRLQRRVSTVGRKVSTKELAQKFRKLSKKRDTNISYKGTSAVAPGPQAARKNRATMRKLAVASEGSDMLRFNMLKVITTHTSSDLRV